MRHKEKVFKNPFKEVEGPSSRQTYEIGLDRSLSKLIQLKKSLLIAELLE